MHLLFTGFCPVFLQTAPTLEPRIFIFVGALFLLVPAELLLLYLVKKIKRLVAGGLIEDAGFAYDKAQDIFYSTRDPWQKEFGYCSLYDDATASLGMVIDCEPIRFSYGGKHWLIEFWKGQYGLFTGAEVGLYYTDHPLLNTPSVIENAFYEAVPDDAFLPMKMALTKDGKRLFMRSQIHWWLTGFLPGEFSQPSQLTAYITITMEDAGMRDAFTQALAELGYTGADYSVKGNNVLIAYTTPRSPQPERSPQLVSKMQGINQELCEAYNGISDTYEDTVEKLLQVQARKPLLYRKIRKGLRPKKLYKKVYQSIRLVNKGR